MNLSDFTRETAIINDNLRADHHSLAKLSVVCAHSGVVTVHGSVNHDLVTLALSELDWLVLLKSTGEQLRTLGVEHDRDSLVLLLVHGLGESGKGLSVRLLQKRRD